MDLPEIMVDEINVIALVTSISLEISDDKDMMSRYSPWQNGFRNAFVCIKPYDIHAKKKETCGATTSRTPENFARKGEKRSPKSKATCQEDCAPNKAQTVEKSFDVVRRTVGITLSRGLGLHMMLES